MSPTLLARRSVVRRFSVVCSTLAMLATSLPVFAEPENESGSAVTSGPSVALSYRAQPGCPDEAEFISGVRARGGKLEGEEALGLAKALSVSIEPETGGYIGRLRVETPSGTQSERELRDPTCAEVVEGLAVVTAIALGGSSEVSSEPTPAPAPKEQPAPPKPAESSPSAPERLHLRGSNFDEVKSVDVSAGTLRFGQRRAFTLSGGASFGFLPGVVVPRYEFSIDAARYTLLPSGQALLASQILQVKWSVFGPAKHRSGEYTTDVWGLKAGVGSCSAITYDSDALELLLCAEFAVGVAALRTRDQNGQSVEYEAGFGTAGIALEPRYNLGSLVHLDPDGSRLFKADLFGGYAVLGVGLHF
jgi:hypothetical protein